MKQPDDASKFITCECHGHGLYMDYFLGGPGYTSELYIIPYGSASYFENGGFFWRLKKAWQMITKGTMAGGEVVLSVSNTIELIDYLIKFKIKSEQVYGAPTE